MKKTVAILLTFIMLLSACSPAVDTKKQESTSVNEKAQKEEEAIVQEASEEEKIEPEEIPLPQSELILWHSFSDEFQGELDRIVEIYNNMDNGIKVKTIRQEPESLQETLEESSEGEVDILIDFPFAYPTQTIESKMVDLDQYIRDSEIGIANFDSIIPSNISEEGTQLGGRYMIPLVKTGELLYYNKTLLDSLGLEAPVTWDEIGAHSERIYSELGITGFGSESSTELADLLINQYTDNIYKSQDVSLIQPKLIETLLMLQNGYQIGLFKTPSEQGSLLGAFENGELGMFMMSSYYSVFMVPEELEFEVGYTNIPQNPQKPYIPLNGPSVFILKTDESRQRASFDFLKYLISEQTNVELATLYHGITPFKYSSNQTYIKYLDENPALKVLATSLDSGTSIPTVDGILRIRENLKEIIDRISEGEAVEDVLNSAASQIRSIMSE